MRKKIILCLLIVISLLLYVYKTHQNDWYYIADNTNGFYDEIYELTATLPSYDVMPLSEEKLEVIKNLDNVEGVYPYLYLTSLDEGQNWEEVKTIIEVCANGETYVVEFPKKVEIEAGEQTTIGAVSMRTYATVEEYFSSNPLLLSMTNCETGIYIPQHFYNALEVPTGTTSLQLTVSIYVPITAKVESVHYTTPIDEYGIAYSDDEYDFYANVPVVNQYQKVTYMFDVQGVCSSYGSSLNVPPQVAKDLLNQIDQSQIVLEENEIFWEPQTYMLVLEKAKTLNSLGKQVDEVIDDFVLNVPKTDKTKSY